MLRCMSLIYFGKVCKEFPRYKSYVHLAVFLIGMLFCGKWFSSCQKCGERSNALTEHMILYCPSANTLRYVLWRRLFSRFDVEFYRQFISLSPSDQVNALFSGFYGLMHDENDRLESLKILLKTFKLLQWQSSFEKLMII